MQLASQLADVSTGNLHLGETEPKSRSTSRKSSVCVQKQLRMYEHDNEHNRKVRNQPASHVCALCAAKIKQTVLPFKLEYMRHGTFAILLWE